MTVAIFPDTEDKRILQNLTSFSLNRSFKDKGALSPSFLFFLRSLVSWILPSPSTKILFLRVTVSPSRLSVAVLVHYSDQEIFFKLFNFICKRFSWSRIDDCEKPTRQFYFCMVAVKIIICFFSWNFLYFSYSSYLAS